MIPIALTIAGSDSSGGAGIQADLKTFSALGVYGASVITALTAQNTQGVRAVHAVPAAFIARQIEAVFEDLAVAAVKIGMVGTQAAIGVVAEGLERWRPSPIVLDPVMVATSGDALLDPGAERALRTRLLPLADLVTPNLLEAARLLDGEVARDEAAMRDQARALADLGARAVLLKGGHGTGPEAVDILLVGGEATRLAAPRIDTRHTHGTGCTLASAIAALMAGGLALPAAAAKAKDYLTEALRRSDELAVGRGAGPVHHFHALWDAGRGPDAA